MLRTGTVALAVLMVPCFVHAHPDAERTLAMITGPAGETLRLARHTTDGVMMSDPVKLVVYNHEGKAIAETPYARDTIVAQGRDGVWRAFQVDGYSLFFRRAWALQGRQLVPDRSWTARIEGIRSLHWGFYVLSAVIGAIGVVTSLRKSRRLARTKSEEFQPTGCGCLAFFWMFIIGIYLPVNLPPILLLGLIFSLPWTRAPGERRVALAVFGVPLGLLLLVNVIDMARSSIGE
jgi:hypothetical protein